MNQIIGYCFYCHHLPKRGQCFAAEWQWRINSNVAIKFLYDCIEQNKPVTIFGTAFSFAHLLDLLKTTRLKHALPDGSAAMKTGGYKGRSREVPKTELHRSINNKLGIPEKLITSEYGMCELSSQAYDGALNHTNTVPHLFRFPPWARARVVSPETMQEVKLGETGLLQITDLANVGSVLSLLTEDLTCRYDNGFELQGRAELAKSRGCSLMNFTYA